jgi:ligand-binding SRPBCC domain-containing protein
MKTYLFNREVWLPRPVDEVFRFFADAGNIQTLTPPWLNFQIVTPGPIEMKPRTLIDYRLRVRGVPIKWQSEITVWDPPHRFVDEQRRGPYRLWIHEHRFLEKDHGTLATDEVRYGVPGDALVNRLFVARDVAQIFDFRARKLKELFSPL